jgi:hypothetical protein
MPRTGARRPSYAPLRPDPSYNFTFDAVNGIDGGLWSGRSGKSRGARTWVTQSNRKVPRTASDRRRRRRKAVAAGPEPERLQDDDEPRDSDRKGPPKNVVADRERELRSREQNLIHRVGPPIRFAAVRPALRASRQSLRRRAIGSASVAWERREEGLLLLESRCQRLQSAPPAGGPMIVRYAIGSFRHSMTSPSPIREAPGSAGEAAKV